MQPVQIEFFYITDAGLGSRQMSKPGSASFGEKGTCAEYLRPGEKLG
ncbi:hypothetical protein [Bacillus swezeyi]